MIVLNKTDLVTPEELDAVEAQIRRINKFAKIHRATKSDVPIAELLDQGAFDLNRVLSHSPDFLTDDEHEHNDDIASMSFEAATPLDPETLQRLDRRAAGRKRPGPAAHQGHPVL